MIVQLENSQKRDTFRAFDGKMKAYCIFFIFPGLDREEKLMKLGSRNFFLCPKTSNSDGAGASSSPSPSSSSCAKEADKANATKISLPWLKFMDFML